MSEDKPWVTLDDLDDEVIVGNREGLELLKLSIDEALKEGDAPVLEGREEFVIGQILFREKESYLAAVTEKYEDNIWQKLIGGSLFLWFIVLPFIAIGLIGYLLFHNEKQYINDICPKMNLAPQQCSPLPNKFNRF
ncbi:MAG: hypothetical protein ACJAYF_001855 [Arenicella sp.]